MFGRMFGQVHHLSFNCGNINLLDDQTFAIRDQLRARLLVFLTARVRDLGTADRIRDRTPDCPGLSWRLVPSIVW